MEINKLSEARMAPLYHWMNRHKTHSVINSNELHGQWRHVSSLSDKEMIGTSMSRNPNFIWGGNVRLVFDQWKLDQKYKIVPLDADYTWEYTTYGPGDRRRDRVRRAKSNVGDIESSVLYPMAEEFVLGTIKPLSKYLLRIDVLPSIDERQMLDITQYAGRFQIPVRQLPQPDFVPVPRRGNAPKFPKSMREAREAPLFHWMDARKTHAIIQDDIMKANHIHRLPWTDEEVKGTSLSRNERFKMGFNRPWRFVFDEGKLSQTNKMVPVDAQAVHRYTIQKDDPVWDPEGNLPFSSVSLKDRKIGRHRGEQFAEEFVLGDISPLSKYLIRIDFYPDAMIQTPAYMAPPGFGQGKSLPGEEYAIAVDRMTRKYAKRHGIPYMESKKEVWRK